MAAPASPRPRLILASASPRRQSLLREAGYSFTISPADIDEAAICSDLIPANAAAAIAQAKATALAARFPDDVVLAADTIVALVDHIIGKAADADHARRILATLSGSKHRVITGVSVIHLASRVNLSETVTSTVEMKSLNVDEIETYIATGQWRGKAGAYGIQDPDPFVRRITGCMTNIVGLPLTTTRRMLAHAGIDTMSGA